MNNSNTVQNPQFKQQFINSPLRNSTTNNIISQQPPSSPVITQMSKSPLQQSSQSQPLQSP
jgi:hypothetical protein